MHPMQCSKLALEADVACIGYLHRMKTYAMQAMQEVINGSGWCSCLFFLYKGEMDRFAGLYNSANTVGVPFWGENHNTCWFPVG